MKSGPMEYSKENNWAAGRIPEFGAIFMSSTMTKKECFSRKIFGLPSSKSEFVERVKAGMILFLFEHEKRQLYGVYQASSDGAMNIVPNAFRYSGKHFPAQVCFKPVWYCSPLSEKEFRDAIMENYFSPKKFNFGLSKDQVHRLLSLFSSRKLKTKLPPRQLPEVVDGIDYEDRHFDTSPFSNIGYMDSTEGNGLKPATLHGFRMNSLRRDNEDEFSPVNGGNAEEELYPLDQASYLGKRRRINNDNRLISNAVAEHEMCNHDISDVFHVNSPKVSLEVRGLDNKQLSRLERFPSENQLDKFHNPFPDSDNLMGPLDKGATDDDQFMQTNKFYKMGYGPELAYESENFMDTLSKSKHQGDRFLFDSEHREQVTCDFTNLTGYDDDKFYSCRQSRSMKDDCHHSVKELVENRYSLNQSGVNVSSFDCSSSFLHKAKNATLGENIPINAIIHSEPNHVLSSVEGFSDENSVCPENYPGMLIHGKKHSTAEGRVTDNTMDGISCSGAQIKDAGSYHFGTVDRQVDDHGMYRMRQRVGNKEAMHTRLSPNASENPSFSKQKESASLLFDKLLEKRSSQLSTSHKFEPLRPMYEDATMTEVVPYLPEHPNISHGYASSMEANNGNPGPVQENPNLQGSLENLYSFHVRMSPYLSGSKVFKGGMDVTPECADDALPADALCRQSYFLQNRSFPKADPSMQTTRNAPAHYRGSINSRLSSSSLSSHNQRNTERERGYIAYPSVSSESQFPFHWDLAKASRVRECDSWQERGMFVGNDAIGSQANHFGVDVCGHVADSTSNDFQLSSMCTSMYGKGCHRVFEPQSCNSSGFRKSVFTRLTSSRQSKVDEERSVINVYSNDDCYMNNSVDEVMEMLHPGDTELVGKSEHEEQNHIQSHTETICSRKEKIDETLFVMEGSVDEEVPKETRTVSFKRRSDMKKSMVAAMEANADNKNMDAEKKMAEGSAMKTLKRRRLVRPVFGEPETARDAVCTNQNLQLLALDRDSTLKGVSTSEAEAPEDSLGLGSSVAVGPHQSLERNTKELSKTDDGISESIAEAPGDSSELGNSVAVEPHQFLECITKEHSKIDGNSKSGAEAPGDSLGVGISVVHQSLECNTQEHSEIDGICKSLAEASGDDNGVRLGDLVTTKPPHGTTGLGDLVTADAHQSLECNDSEEQSKTEVQNNVGAVELSSKRHELERAALETLNLPTETCQQ
ncbi:uncharacterized protein LOC127248057 isoform X2 [Andrographis paniculata]|uniref:uncharacterized protein LOC127248057 isoform X2 n=1 Tax=Andrographis paniculata TaxID=175694 RepID=UPI0021E9319F|nr:uncharacterized protein LOC127248057 isoform X2 [Andrographis paniculata]